MGNNPGKQLVNAPESLEVFRGNHDDFKRGDQELDQAQTQAQTIVRFPEENIDQLKVMDEARAVQKKEDANVSNGAGRLDDPKENKNALNIQQEKKPIISIKKDKKDILIKVYGEKTLIEKKRIVFKKDMDLFESVLYPEEHKRKAQVGNERDQERINKLKKMKWKGK